MRKTYILLFSCLLATISTVAHPSWGMAIDDDGNIYFADIFHNGRGTLWKRTEGHKLEPILTDFHAHNVNLDKDGYPVSAHGEDNHTMVRILPDGSLDTLFHTLDLKEFFGGNAAYSKQGNIYFQIDKYIWKIDKNGVKTRYNDHQLEWNQMIFVDDDENLYVSDIGVGNGTIFKFDTSGTVTKIAEDLIAKLDRPKDKHNDVLLGMTKDEDDNLYVCEIAGRRVLKINNAGIVSTFIELEKEAIPAAVCIKGNIIYLLEFRGVDFNIIQRSLNSQDENLDLNKEAEELKNSFFDNRKFFGFILGIGFIIVFLIHRFR